LDSPAGKGGEGCVTGLSCRVTGYDHMSDLACLLWMGWGVV